MDIYLPEKLNMNDLSKRGICLNVWFKRSIKKRLQDTFTNTRTDI